MSTAAVIERTVPTTRGWDVPGFRLARAELLKLRTRRGLVLASLALTVGSVVVAYAILLLLHLTDSAGHGPAGGSEHFWNGMYLLTALGTMAAVLIGATAGAGDLSAGVFRNLVTTGRSRRSLYLARIPGGLALLLPIAAVAYAVGAVLAVGLAGNLPQPGTVYLVESGLWFLLYMTAMFLLALGVSSFLGSRATTIGILAGVQLLVTPLVQGLHHPGVGAESILGIALWQLAPKELQNGAPNGDIHMSLAAIVTVLVAWMAVAVGAGLWRTVKRDA
jgi:ABC-type transport system involved in multi-copper enzyme maturation permease subunit